MIEVKLIDTAGWYAAMLALHLPFGEPPKSVDGNINMADEKLLNALVKAGDDHAKVTRGIVAYLEINAPRYWWVEMDTYRIGRETLASESTMHIQGHGLSEDELVAMKSSLTEGTMQRRIVMLSYQTLRRIYHQRKHHRLPEWRGFCNWLVSLPYSWLITITQSEQ